VGCVRGVALGRSGEFKGRQFTAEVLLWAVRWYLMFPVSYRDLELMLLDRGVEVDHTTIFRWIQAYSPELERRMRPHLRPCTISWRVDETYVKVKGRWMYLYRAVDSRGDTIDFLLSARRDAAAVVEITGLRNPCSQLNTYQSGLMGPCRTVTQTAT
jgi:transposase, IS6 family